MYGLTDRELETILKILNNNDVLKDSYKRGSDVDIAILGDELKLSYCLNEESNLPYFFDVINLEKISNENLKEHIRRAGKELL